MNARTKRRIVERKIVEKLPQGKVSTESAAGSRLATVGFRIPDRER
jgi:hypothetical protein